MPVNSNVFTGADGSLTLSAARRAAAPAGPTTDAGAILAALRVNQSYEQQTVGDIARDLAGRAGVPTGTIADGVSLPFVVVDDRRSVYQHLAALARSSGLLASIAPDGKLVVPPRPAGRPCRRSPTVRTSSRWR